ncbi:MAG TPA: polyprenyl synthetase family protein [Anaerolineae bacterium]|nr:polyprenyl synthetase family protein [Anaerolineae bacterium]
MRRSVGRAENAAYAPFFGMLHYHLGWVDTDFASAAIPVGKRIRPLLCLLTCEAAGGDAQTALPAAAAVELLHNFSLIHDDVEDRSELRRGRSTLWTQWGVAQAINAGDALFTIAHSAFHQLREHDVPFERQVKAHACFTQTCLQLTQGQFLDLSFEARSDVAIDDYLEMIDGKTAALVSGASAIGAIIAGSDTVDHYAEFGRAVGLAFQIEDDLLGIWGDPKVTGKSAASDIASRKKSLPVIYGLERSEALRAQYAAPEIDAPRVVETLEQIGAKAYAEQIAREYTQRALAALDAAELCCEAGEALTELAQSLLGRRA